MGKIEPLHTTGRTVNWYSYYGKQDGGFLKKKKKLNTELPHNSVILLLIYKQRKGNMCLEEVSVLSCSSQYYSQ